MTMLKISTAPHISSPTTTRSIMLDVIFALMPALIASVLFFGINALIITLTAVASCVFFEYAAHRWFFKTEPHLWNCSAIVTGILLAFNLPSNIPLVLVIVGSFVAIVVAKAMFGGLGKNIFNPALVGRVFLFISFPAFMSSWPKPHFADILNFDAATSATPLALMKHSEAVTSATKLAAQADIMPDYMQMFLGNTGGCLGETSALALLLGFAYLMLRKVVSWKIPFFYIGTVFILFAAAQIITGNQRFDAVAQILSGGLMLGALFMATDYTTSPMTEKGRAVFAIGCGVLTFIIREYSAYPEGVSFAILIMNAFVPLIDKIYIPKLFGIGKK